MKKILNLILLSVIGSIGTAAAQMPSVITSDKTGWHKIAETTVDFKKDRDNVSVLVADRFAAIQFKVDDAPIDITSVVVNYESGDKQTLAVNDQIKSNTSSKIIKLNGGERNIKSITLIYKTMPNSKDEKAHVEIWGLKTNTDEAKPKSESKMQSPSIMLSDSKGWHKIGSRTVDFVKDHDEFMVVGADRFSSLKFKAVDASVSLISIEVYFESGDNQKIDVGTAIAAGTESSEIDLNGGERSLKKIVIEYKTIPNQTADKAIVEVYGYKTNSDQKATIK